MGLRHPVFALILCGPDVDTDTDAGQEKDRDTNIYAHMLHV